jgi:hypothetical protein
VIGTAKAKFSQARKSKGEEESRRVKMRKGKERLRAATEGKA